MNLNLLEEIVLAERVGLDSFGIGEDHRGEFVDPAPAVILGAAACFEDYPQVLNPPTRFQRKLEQVIQSFSPAHKQETLSANLDHNRAHTCTARVFKVRPLNFFKFEGSL